MREIKFRVWSGSKKAMYRVLGYSDIEQCFFVQGKGRGQAPLADIVLMQYTGLEDKNGNEIYEGDIVENTTQTVYLGDKYEVVWNKNYAGYQLMSNGFTSNIPLIQNFMSYKVIGNIYENPELLKDEEQTGGTERKERV